MQNSTHISKYIDNISMYSRAWQYILNLQVPVYAYEYTENNTQKVVLSLDLPELKNEHKYFKLEILSRMATLNIFAENVIIGKKRLTLVINQENILKFDVLIDERIRFSNPDDKTTQRG